MNCSLFRSLFHPVLLALLVAALPLVRAAEDAEEKGPLRVAELDRTEPVDFAKELFPVMACPATTPRRAKANSTWRRSR